MAHSPAQPCGRAGLDGFPQQARARGSGPEGWPGFARPLAPFRQHTQPSILLVASAHYVHAANNDAGGGSDEFKSSRCRTDTEAACACRKFGAQPVPGGRNYGVQTSKGVPENHFCPPLVSDRRTHTWLAGLTCGERGEVPCARTRTGAHQLTPTTQRTSTVRGRLTGVRPTSRPATR